MPELPEVETIVRELTPKLTGKSFKGIDIYWERTVDGKHSEFIKILKGNTITSVDRRGKYICFYLESGDKMTLHLRMTGKLLFELCEKDKPYLRVAFTFNHRLHLYFVDTRKFGRIKIWKKGTPFLPNIGPEPLKQQSVFHVLHNLKSKRAIKTTLLDQSVLAGIGNIYADEAFFLAGIHPATPASLLTPTEREKLSQTIPHILLNAIENKGTTISDYRKTDHSMGNNQFYLNVYGREKEGCRRCGTRIQRITLNNRSSYFCETCQPLTVD